MEFRDRREAGRRLAERLRQERFESPLVLALPRGGAVIGAEVARALKAPLDVLVVRKIGSPDNPEFGIGALAEEGYAWINPETASAVGATPEEIEAIVRSETREARRRIEYYRGGRPLPDIRGRTVIVVDDGLATGVTARVGCRYLRARGAGRIVLAVPVASPSTSDILEDEADEIIALEQPELFYSVGQFYEDFAQVTDQEVVALLQEARALPHGARVVDLTVDVTDGEIELAGQLTVPAGAQGIVLFAHGSGSSRLSPRNRQVAASLNDNGFGTLLFDLLTPEESEDRDKVFDIPLLAERLEMATRWLRRKEIARNLPLGYFGASTGAAAALRAAAELGERISAVVSRGGRPDLAMDRLDQVTAPTLLIVGGFDEPVIELNRQALRGLAHGELVIVPGATHLFEEPGTLEEVAVHAIRWFERCFTGGIRRAA